MSAGPNAAEVILGRTVVVTGSASGIGRATAELLRDRGDRVIGVDLRDAEVLADLGTGEGRFDMVRRVEALAGEAVDSVIAAAGIAGAAEPRRIVAINYFGALATLQGLRPLLARSSAPRAVVVLSTAALPELAARLDDTLIDACLAGDEQTALDVAEGTAVAAYPSSKRALGIWLRQSAVRPEWAGSGVLLNAVAPGCVLTAMTTPLLATEEGRTLLAKRTPIAVQEYGRPEELAEVLAFFATLSGRYTVGQILFVDGGTQALTRPRVV